MEKPSTKKPMNILKTMVFLKNFMENNEKFEKILSIIKIIFTSIMLITLFIWAIIEKQKDLLYIMGFAILLAFVITIFFIAYTKAISNK